MLRRFLRKLCLLVFVAFLQHSAQAVSPFVDTSPKVPAFIRCRALADDAARLSCFDLAAAAMEQALTGGELMLVEMARVQEARKSRFGFPDNGADLLGGKEAGEINGTIRTARSTADGWVVTLEDGSMWQQVDATTSAVDPRAGLEATIRRAALGSYRLILNPHAAFKVKRVR